MDMGPTTGGGMQGFGGGFGGNDDFGKTDFSTAFGAPAPSNPGLICFNI
jgi:hypothetical protein